MSDQKCIISWKEIITDTLSLAQKITSSSTQEIAAIIAVGRGGNIPGTLLSYHLGVKTVFNYNVQTYNNNNVQDKANIDIVQMPSFDTLSRVVNGRVLVVDDLSDNGTTLHHINNALTPLITNLEFCTLYTKQGTSFVPNHSIREYEKDKWIYFPWDDLRSSLAF